MKFERTQDGRIILEISERGLSDQEARELGKELILESNSENSFHAQCPECKNWSWSERCAYQCNTCKGDDFYNRAENKRIQKMTDVQANILWQSRWMKRV